MLFLPERREGTGFSSPNDERGHAFPPRTTTKQARSKARSGPAMFAPPICRRSGRNASRAELVSEKSRFVGFDEDGGSPANIAASGASH
jgi:hypothetical protein